MISQLKFSHYIGNLFAFFKIYWREVMAQWWESDLNLKAKLVI